MAHITSARRVSPTFAFRGLAGLSLYALLGCAVSNEGAVDYRKAELLGRAPPPAQRLAGLAPAAGRQGTVVAAQADRPRALPETRVKLQRQAMRGEDSGARLEAEDSISIHLRTAFLKDFEAAIGHPLRGFRPNGEIAIVVKAFEFGDGKDFNFGPDAAQINKGLSSATIDLANNTFGKFLDELDQRDLQRAEDLQGLQDEIEKLGFARTQARELDSARDLLAEWRTAQRAGDLGEAKRAAFKLFGILQEAVRVETATPGKADLSKEQITYLLDRLAKMADASSHADLQKFTLAGFSTAAANFDALFDTINHGMSA
jgi:hypothetical protein